MIYTHRNGEAEAPTVTGLYWFRGKRRHWRGGLTEWTTDTGSLLRVHVTTGEMLPYGSYWTNGKCLQAAGEWWGPVVAPWEEER